MDRYIKDPDAVLDYQFNWATWLGTDETISTSTMIVETGLTADSDTNDDTTATIWVSGGTLGKRYRITNRIVSNAARTADWSIEIYVMTR